MTLAVTIPNDLWEEDSQAVITAWLANDGAHVREGDLIAEVMVEKVQYEIHAPTSGTLRIAQEVDAVVSKGDRIGSIG